MLLGLADKPGGDQGMASKTKEVVADVDCIGVEYL